MRIYVFAAFVEIVFLKLLNNNLEEIFLGGIFILLVGILDSINKT